MGVISKGEDVMKDKYGQRRDEITAFRVLNLRDNI
jgi:hypothetical protein